MATFNLISLGEAIESLHRRPGIVLGPDATRAPGELARALEFAIKQCGVSIPRSSISDSDCRSLIDHIRHEHPSKAELLESEFREGIRRIPPSLDINHLAKAGWSACISLSEDLIFETALRCHLDSIPGTRTTTTIDRVGEVPPHRTIPVFKLLGNVLTTDPESRLALSEADLLLRQQHWRLLLQSFSDFVREGAVFLSGVTSCLPLTRQILGVLSAMPKPRPTRLFFLKNEGVLTDPTVSALCAHFQTATVDGTLRDLCAALAELKPTVTSPAQQQPSTKASESFENLLQKHHHLVSLVPNDRKSTQSSSMDLPSLLDGLFRPAAQKWQPFQQQLDIRRTATDDLMRSLEALLAQAPAGDPRYFLVRGEAGVGKTTLLKRLALELAQEGIVTLWCGRTSGGSWLRAFKTLVGELAQSVKSKDEKALKFAVFCDDPWGLRIDAADLISCFDRFPASLLFVFSARNSDYGTSDISGSGNGFVEHDEFEVPYELDKAELEQLASMLVRIEAVKDLPSAHREIAKIPSRHSTDILCSLWYLIPETRMQLAESLRDEYCRLGAARDAVSTIAESARANGGSVAHGAYEYVTVTSNLNIGLPVEVLVHALGINYFEWLETVGHGRPLWGLLYDTQDEREETILYFTRNEVVTRVLLDLVNGGVGHAGEFRILRHLLSACSSGALIYRNFVLDVLIRGRKKLSEFITYEQGIELFDVARKALPHEDRLIEHHRGIWMQDVGHDDQEAYRQFEHALLTKVYPGADRDAPKEHIHTSMAASVVKLIRAGKQDPEGGAAQAREHLRQATSPRFFNSHTSHVAAGLLFDLAKIDAKGIQSDSALSNLVEAFHEIEKARQVLGARGQELLRNRKNLEMMADLEKRILGAIPADRDLKTQAQAMFDRTGSQAGFEVCARRLLVEASQTSKGKDFNEVNDYLNQCMTAIEDCRMEPTPELLIVRVDLYVRWRVQRFSSVDWEVLRDDLADVLQSGRYRDDVIKTFYYAVALFHCGEITEANALFATLRRWQPATFGARETRCYFLDDSGNPQRFQGTYKKEHQQWYFDVPELNVSVPARGTPTVGAGAITHAYLGFALNGLLALDHRPDKSDYILP